MAQAQTLAAPALAQQVQINFTNLNFDVIIHIAELLNIDVLLSLYLAMKKSNPHKVSHIIEALTRVINKRLFGPSTTTKSIYDVAHILRNLSDYDTKSLPIEFIRGVCELGDSETIIPLAIANHESLLPKSGFKQKARHHYNVWGRIRHNEYLTNQLRLILMRDVMTLTTYKQVEFYNKVIINESGDFPDCFIHPMQHMNKLFKNMNCEDLVPFMFHVFTSMMNAKKAFRRLRNPEKIAEARRMCNLKFSTMKNIIKQFNERKTKDEFYAFMLDWGVPNRNAKMIIKFANTLEAEEVAKAQATVAGMVTALAREERSANEVAI